MSDLTTALDFLLESSLLFNSEETPFKVQYIEGDPRFVLILGDNASGKSLAFRLLKSRLSDAGKRVAIVSIRERVGNPFNDMGGFAKTLMYGYEHEQSTGATTLQVLNKAFKHLGGEGYDVVGIDEPEIGMSERLHAALGENIFNKYMEHPEGSVILITHSRRLLRSLLSRLPSPPTTLLCSHVSSPLHPSLDAWLEADSDLSLEYLNNLESLALEGYRSVHKVLKS